MNRIRPKVLISQKMFDEVVAFVKDNFEVEENQTDTPLSTKVLIQKLQDKVETIILLTDQIDDHVLSQCPDLKIICNVAVGYNHIDIEACTRRRVTVTNTPGVLDDTTADFTWTLLLATARRVDEADQYLRSLKWKR